MSDGFDPYRKWLAIPPEEQPPNHYQLLGIPLLENDPDVIENAANRQMAHVRTFQSGRHAAHSQKILNELSAAKICLLNPERKDAYDRELQKTLSTKSPPPASPPPPRVVTGTPPTLVPPAKTTSRESIHPTVKTTVRTGRPGPLRTASTSRRVRSRKHSIWPPILLGLVALAGLTIVMVVVLNLVK